MVLTKVIVWMVRKLFKGRNELKERNRELEKRIARLGRDTCCTLLF